MPRSQPAQASIFRRFACSFGSHLTTRSTIFLITASRLALTAESRSDSCFLVELSMVDWELEVWEECCGVWERNAVEVYGAGATGW